MNTHKTHKDLSQNRYGEPMITRHGRSSTGNPHSPSPYRLDRGPPAIPPTIVYRSDSSSDFIKHANLVMWHMWVNVGLCGLLFFLGSNADRISRCENGAVITNLCNKDRPDWPGIYLQVLF